MTKKKTDRDGEEGQGNGLEEDNTNSFGGGGGFE
jgi:hypothetical protein